VQVFKEELGACEPSHRSQGVRGTGRWFSVRKEEDDRYDVGLRWRDWAELGKRDCLEGVGRKG
jgi:hypothetical protein